MTENDSIIQIQVQIEGIRPLLQNAFLQSSTEIRRKGIVHDEYSEAEGRLIRNADGVICQPAIHLESCINKSASEYKFRGRKTYKDLVRAGVFVEPSMIRHLVQNWCIDKQSVMINKARIIRCRPRLDVWRLKFILLIRDERVQPLVLKAILETGGKFHGIGDYRPRYGLFKVLEFNL